MELQFRHIFHTSMAYEENVLGVTAAQARTVAVVLPYVTMHDDCFASPSHRGVSNRSVAFPRTLPRPRARASSSSPLGPAPCAPAPSSSTGRSLPHLGAHLPVLIAPRRPRPSATGLARRGPRSLAPPRRPRAQPSGRHHLDSSAAARHEQEGEQGTRRPSPGACGRPGPLELAAAGPGAPAPDARLLPCSSSACELLRPPKAHRRSPRSLRRSWPPEARRCSCRPPATPARRRAWGRRASTRVRVRPAPETRVGEDAPERTRRSAAPLVQPRPRQGRARPRTSSPGEVAAEQEATDQVAVDVAGEGAEDEEETRRDEAMELERIGSQCRAVRSRSGRPPPLVPRSHSTGHSLATRLDGDLEQREFAFEERGCIS
ncbi:predicted GPI-anchored protein 58 [Panicum virgatum]|uniref:predicted GPI-anchored protein 58 n=1 Tax=Panicum virgatum TaxID=38727 RepID=UPI0019D619EE|nr:predicted GPI-anchored protein 58 [Panicum virgatum]